MELAKNNPNAKLVYGISTPTDRLIEWLTKERFNPFNNFIENNNREGELLIFRSGNNPKLFVDTDINDLNISDKIKSETLYFHNNTLKSAAKNWNQERILKIWDQLKYNPDNLPAAAPMPGNLHVRQVVQEEVDPVNAGSARPHRGAQINKQHDILVLYNNTHKDRFVDPVLN